MIVINGMAQLSVRGQTLFTDLSLRVKYLKSIHDIFILTILVIERKRHLTMYDTYSIYLNSDYC